MADPAEYPDADIERWIEQAKCMFNACIWGCNLELGEAYWIAHQLAVADILEAAPPGAGATGAIASKQVGDTKISYVQSSAVATATAAAENPLLWTKYGQLYQSLLNSLPGGVGIMVV